MKKHIYFKLFITTFQINLFTFGGGYVIIPMMRQKFVDELKWIEEQEMLDLISIAQSAPGIMAVNTSIIVGKKVAGFIGSLIALLATIIPPFVLMYLLSIIYKNYSENQIITSLLDGMQLGVAAVVICAAISMLNDAISDNNKTYSIISLVAAFVLSFFFKVNVIFIIIAAIILSLIKYLLVKGKNKYE